MRKLARLLVVFVVLVTGGFARAGLGEDKQQLSDLEKGCATALVKGDVQWLATFYADDWVLIGSDGLRVTRQRALAQLNSGDLKWKSCELGELDIRVFGDTAVVVYKATSVGEMNGAKIEETEVCSDTFVRMDDHWRCVHSHNCQPPQG